MGSYVTSIIATSVICAFVCAICPEDNGLGKFVALCASFVIVLVIVSPVRRFASDNKILVEDFSSFDSSDIDYSHLAARTFSTSVANTISEKFDLEVEKIIVDTVDSEDFLIRCVKIYTENYVDHSEVKSYLEEQYNCEFIVVVGGL